MTEVETIAGSTANGTKPFSPDENPGAPEMGRVHRTPVPGLAPQPDFGATDPAASRFAPDPADNGRATDPYVPTAIDADPTDTVKVSTEGADKAAEQDKDSDQARKDEANDQSAGRKDSGPDFAGIKERARADEENRKRDLKAQSDDPAINPKNNPPRSNETDTIVQQSSGARIGGLAGEPSVDNAGAGYQEPEPAIGRIVMYTTTQEDADRMNVRRVYGPKGEDGSALEEGVSVQAGTVYPAIITSVGDRVVNLHVFADGNHGVWIRDVGKGDGGGSWSWPVIK